MIKSFFTIFFLLFFSTFSWAQEVHLPTVPLSIMTHQGETKFTVELAISEKDQEHGLMNRTHIPEGEGMLFLFDVPRPVHMWMKNTLVPLDMIFIDTHGVITEIAERTTPGSEKNIGTGDQVRAVLEVAGGTVEGHHIAVGDIVHYAAFK